ncbi:MAG: SCO family protein [Burkholderiaceae bacterium]
MSVQQNLSPPQPGQQPGQQRRKAAPNNRRVLLLLILVCVAPVIASYLAYYFLPPDGRVNYGDLVDPQREVAGLATAPLAGLLPADQKARLALDTPRAPATADSVSLGDWRGRWLMVLLAPADCPQACQTNLYNMRQVRLTTGKYRDRVQRLWLVSDQGEPSSELLAGHKGMVAARVSRDAANGLFVPADGKPPMAHIFLVDPLGNLMMRFPADANPSRMKKDMIRLLKASRIG